MNIPVKIVVGGAIDKQKVADEVIRLGGDRVEVRVMSDIEAALAVKNGTAQYYFGACATGGGGALAMAMALLGPGRCVTVSMPGSPPKEEIVQKAVAEGKVAFGFTNDHIQRAVPMILPLLLDKE